MVNRAPVLTLWAAVVADVLGFEHDEALTLGGAVAGLNAYSKGVSLGLFRPTPKEVKRLAEKAYTLYEIFRPEIPPGKKGWGASGKLDLDLIRKMASARSRWAFVEFSCPILDPTHRLK